MINSAAKKNLASGKFDYFDAFYNRSHNAESFVEGIDKLTSSYDLQVKSIPFSSERQPSEWFPKISKRSKKIKLIKKYDGIQLFQMTYNYKEGSEEKEGNGSFFIYEHHDYPKVYTAVTIEPGDFFRRVLFPFFESLSPRLMMTFISHKKLRKLMEKFQADHQFTNLIITRASHKFRFKNKGEFPLVSWPRMELQEAFDWIYENNGWFKSLKFKAMDKNHTAAEIAITRQGVIQADRHFSKVFKNFILPVCKTIHENIEFFGNRSRQSNRNLSAKPLAIDFGNEQFAGGVENKKFIQCMRRLDRASVSVIHGNPYIHLSLADYFDGSTFDLWVLNPEQLYIVPQMKASVSSIKRIINHVFDTYAEGDIKDYKEALN